MDDGAHTPLTTRVEGSADLYLQIGALVRSPDRNPYRKWRLGAAKFCWLGAIVPLTEDPASALVWAQEQKNYYNEWRARKEGICSTYEDLKVGIFAKPKLEILAGNAFAPIAEVPMVLVCQRPLEECLGDPSLLTLRGMRGEDTWDE